LGELRGFDRRSGRLFKREKGQGEMGERREKGLGLDEKRSQQKCFMSLSKKNWMLPASGKKEGEARS